MVLYRDLYAGTLQLVNLISVIKLGYNFDKIPYLQPSDTMALIVEDKIHRPSPGIPQQWKISHM
jgi:hypothetical protein